MGMFDQPDSPLSRLFGFSPQEQNLYWHHFGNLHGTGRVTSPNGDISTVLQAVVDGPGGQFYSIPTVWGGQVLTVPEATQRAAGMGWNYWPSYPTADQADLRYDMLHQLMDQDTARFLAGR